VNDFIKYSTLAVFVGAGMGVAHADTAETKGGIKIKTDDGRFEANVGGRIHFDANFVNEDNDAPFGSAGTENDGFFFRRVYLTLKGKAYGWNYKIEPDFAPNNSTGATNIAFQDIYLSTTLGPGEIIFGQIKPFHGMEELTSSNDLTMIERPYASAAGIFNGGRSREFQPGVYYKGTFLEKGTYGLGGYSLRRADTATTQGTGGNARVTFAPILDTGKVLHLGASYTIEKPDQLNNEDSATPPGTTGNIGTSVAYAGRRGPSFSLGSTAAFDKAETLGAELAGQFGPFVAQAEYMTQDLGQGDGADSQTVDAYYLQLSYMLTGEKKAYKKDDGFFGSVKPINSYGAFELTARYDHGENKDAANEPEVQTTTVGVNWYVNPNVRFMANYVMGKAERVNSGVLQQDEPSTIALRAQFSF
jgi:phosphate-selective porin OprO/OprP